ncbi:dinitrogenase iron-molybdenum cofactor biosynthesis protein [Candidatus Woesearchaeota archaeon]|nr:dinitrogenase iron-molybdenum cofactor biosynthesis protein [Candidatus Woesearchaeota archaeon]
MKILIAIDENNGPDSKLSEHFGHCPFFAIYETNTKKLRIVINELDHSSSGVTPVDQIMKFEPNIVFSKGMGKRAIGLFNEKGVKIKTGPYKTVIEVINNINNLKELNEECGH